MPEPPAELASALKNLKRTEARHAAGLSRVHDAMRRARRDGASFGQLMAWTGYSRTYVIQLTRGLRPD